MQAEVIVVGAGVMERMWLEHEAGGAPSRAEASGEAVPSERRRERSRRRQLEELQRAFGFGRAHGRRHRLWLAAEQHTSTLEAGGHVARGEQTVVPSTTRQVHWPARSTGRGPFPRFLVGPAFRSEAALRQQRAHG